MSHPSNKVTLSNLDDVFSYHAPTGDQLERYESLRSAAKDFVTRILTNCPDCADRAAAIHGVRDALMAANASIALEPMDEE